jgi:hypothetical protein
MIEPDARTLVAANGADFRIGGARAFYSPSGDFVRVPPPQAYFEPINWHRTAFHELGHYAEVRIMPHGAMECAIMPVIYHAVFGIISAFPGTRATDRPAGSGLARLRRLAPCSKSAAIWGTAAVALTHSERQSMTLKRHRGTPWISKPPTRLRSIGRGGSTRAIYKNSSDLLGIARRICLRSPRCRRLFLPLRRKTKRCQPQVLACSSHARIHYICLDNICRDK